MGRNLTSLPISASFQYLLQKSGSAVNDGLGNDVTLLDITASNATSASYATTASYALNVTPLDTGSFLVTGSVTDATLTFEKGDFSLFNLVVNNVANAVTATTASYAVYAGTSGYAGISGYAVSASQAETANTASFLPASTDLLINSITANDASFTSASIGHLTTVTGSAVIIGDAFVVVNSSPTSRYAGIKVYESGAATPTTASLQFDSVTNDWFYEYTGSDPTNFGVVMFGPEYATKGSPSYPTANTLVKGNGGHHLIDSSITDDGTDVVVSANISASGFVSASTYYGDGSNLSGLSVSAFPYTGSADISGSINVVGDANIGVNNTITKQSGDEGVAIVGGSNNTINHTATNTFGDNMVIIGGYNVTLSGGFINETTAVGSRNHTIGGQYNKSFGASGGSNSAGFGNTVVGGSGNSITNNAFNTIVGGTGNAMGANAAYNIVLGGGSNNMASGAGSYNALVAGQSNITNGGTHNVILGGSSNTLSHNRSIILGGSSISSDADDTVFTPSIKATGSLQVIDANSTGNTIYMKGGTLRLDTDSYNSWAGIDVGQGNSLSPALGNTAFVFGIGNNNGSANGGFCHGENNTINSPSYGSVIIGAYGATLGASFSGIFAGTAGNNSHNNSVILGGDSLATSKSEEAVVQHLSVYGSMIGDVGAITVTSSTGSLDCSTGNYFTLALQNGVDTRLEASNIQAGQTINIKITNNATAAGTISFGPEFQFEDGIAFTATAATSAVDVITAVSFDGTSLQVVGVKNFS